MLLLSSCGSKVFHDVGPAHIPCTSTTGGRQIVIFWVQFRPVAEEVAERTTDRDGDVSSELPCWREKSGGGIYRAKAIVPLLVLTAVTVTCDPELFPSTGRIVCSIPKGGPFQKLRPTHEWFSVRPDEQ